MNIGQHSLMETRSCQTNVIHLEGISLTVDKDIMEAQYRQKQDIHLSAAQQSDLKMRSKHSIHEG